MDEVIGGAKTGFQTVLREEHDPAVPPPGAELTEQIELLPLTGSASETAEAKAAGGDGVKRMGRPPGSKNRSTEEWRNFLLSRYSSPLIGMAQIYSRNVVDLARDLGFITDKGRVAKPEELLELLKLQLQCMKELAPYMHSKMPMAIEAGERGLINLTIGAATLQGQEAINQGAFTVDFVDVDSGENIPAKAQNSVDKNQNSVAQDFVAADEMAEIQGIQQEKQTDTESVGAGGSE